MPCVVFGYINMVGKKRKWVYKDIHELNRIDASQYDEEHKLKIRRIYDLIPVNLENKKKRIVYKQIENKTGKHFADYADEFEYPSNSGVAIEVLAISNPSFQLLKSEQKRLGEALSERCARAADASSLWP